MQNNDKRQLVTLRKVDEIIPIEGADSIELVRFGGWQCVTKKGELTQGDDAIYFEIDSMLPATDERFEFLASRGKKTCDGVDYYRLLTIKLRGQLSQGLALPTELFPEIHVGVNCQEIDELLGVIKYEPASFGKVISADAKGSFPSFIRKTDAERLQNIPFWQLQQMLDMMFEASVKMDGSSMTIYVKDGEVGVCSRNLELKITEDANDSFVGMFNKSGIGESLLAYNAYTGHNIAIQGELIGPRIQNNFEDVESNQYHVFNIWDIDAQRYLGIFERVCILSALCNSCDLLVVPQIDAQDGELVAPNSVACVRKLKDIIGVDIDADENTVRQKIMDYAEGSGVRIQNREGVVFKSMDGRITFKAISNNYLLKQK